MYATWRCLPLLTEWLAHWFKSVNRSLLFFFFFFFVYFCSVAAAEVPGARRGSAERGEQPLADGAGRANAKAADGVLRAAAHHHARVGNAGAW
jgi:hypothetical protein